MYNYPIRMRYMGVGVGHNDLVEFIDKFNGVILDSDNFWAVGSEINVLRSIELDKNWKEEICQEINFVLKMPINTPFGWYVSAGKNMYLRKSGKVLELTGYGTEDYGYWCAYEEALEAKNKYENKNVFPCMDIVIHSGNNEPENEGCIQMFSFDTSRARSFLLETMEEVLGKLPNENHDDQYDSSKYFDVQKLYDKELIQSFEKNGVFKSSGNIRGDGGMVNYYEIPEGTTQLSDLIYHKGMNHSVGEAFCALYRLNDNGEKERNIRKVIRYMELELEKCSDHS